MLRSGHISKGRTRGAFDVRIGLSTCRQTTDRGIRGAGKTARRDDQSRADPHGWIESIRRGTILHFQETPRRKERDTRMHYLLFYKVGEDYVSRRAEFRDAHLEKAW